MIHPKMKHSGRLHQLYRSTLFGYRTGQASNKRAIRHTSVKIHKTDRMITLVSLYFFYVGSHQSVYFLYETNILLIYTYMLLIFRGCRVKFSRSSTLQLRKRINNNGVCRATPHPLHKIYMHLVSRRKQLFFRSNL